MHKSTKTTEESHPGPKICQVPLSRIRVDGGTQPRVNIDPSVVDDYAETPANEFPPVDCFFDGSDFWLAEGFHRFHAAKKRGDANITATRRNGTVRDAILFSCGANYDHGVRRSNADKRKAVETLFKDEEWSKYSDGKIAQICAVSQNFVSELHRQLKSDLSSTEPTKRVGRDGKARSLPSKKKKPATTEATIEVNDVPPMLRPHAYDVALADQSPVSPPTPSVRQLIIPGNDSKPTMAEIKVAFHLAYQAVDDIMRLLKATKGELTNGHHISKVVSQTLSAAKRKITQAKSLLAGDKVD